ncbi:MAG: small ribosomal subunit biogenesis GTPase RsgA [Leptolyngbyaceae cyanobacterium CRU_2_3]|nr:small ribosomal subunit biogenesis GTPase RsgA [Leptolyngbyaceae cyanobacterium CRU_2_3]
MSDALEEMQLNPQSSGLDPVLGTVLAVQANYYWVQLHPPTPQAHLLCTRRSRLKKIGQQVMVGDEVQVEEPDWAGGRGAISQVLPRQTVLDRPPIANADQILLVFALEEPTLDPSQLSRFLIKAESTELSVLLCLNKSDLVTPEVQQRWCDRLNYWGYAPILISLRAGFGLTALQAQLIDRMTVVCGPSGVGKSSLTNRLIPKVDQRVNAVSGKLSRGRHTTRHVELFQLPRGGLIADTPGFNQPDLTCVPSELARYFPEASQRLASDSCQFSNCLHRDEPNCVVRGNWERYEYYLAFLEEAIAHQEALDRTSHVDASTKLKNKGDGQLQSEPMLARKKYRRPSRRMEKQDLQNLCQDIAQSIAEDD